MILKGEENLKITNKCRGGAVDEGQNMGLVVLFTGSCKEA